jgi:predicted permease
MNESGRSVHGSAKTRRLLGAFVIAEIAVAVVIVAGAARLMRSYKNLENLNPGFNARGLLALDVTLPPPSPSPAARQQRQAWWDETESALRAAGATEVAATSSLPLEPHEWDVTQLLDLVSRPNPPPDRQPNARIRSVTPDFFRVMGIALVAGRPITGADTLQTRAIGVVNEAFATRNLGGASPIGEQIKNFGGHLENGKYVPDQAPIVGVVRNVKYATLAGAIEPVVYIPFAQAFVRRATIVVGTADGAPERHAAEFETAMWHIEPRLAIQATSLPAIVAASLERERLGMWLMLGFGAAALLLAAIGMFGVIAYVVSQRAGEMAVRQALGATQGQILATVMRDGGRAVAAGVLMGICIAWWTGRLVTRYVFAVSAHDPLVLGASAFVVALFAILATLVPARRAASVELARALRGE